MSKNPKQVTAFGEINITYHYDESYRQNGDEWMPQRAEFEIVVPDQPGEAGLYRAVEVTLGAGPDELYRYFPFSSFLYADDRLETIAEFSHPFEDVLVTLRMPVGRSVRVCVVTELRDIRPLYEDTSEKRDLAILLKGVRLGAVVPAPRRGKASIAPFDDHQTQHLASLVSHAPRPVFVLGPYRSGTSILAWTIGQHPNIFPTEETGWFRLLGGGALAGQRSARGAKRDFFSFYGISSEEYMAHVGSSIDDFMRKASLRRAHTVMLERLAGKQEIHKNFQVVRSAFNPKLRWVDGTPENTEDVLLLRMLFPAARFLFMLRNPLDVVVSMAHFHRAGGMAANVHEAGAMWLRLTRAGFFAWKAFGPQVMRVMRHEEVFASPSAALRDVFDFLEEADFPQAARTFEERINSSRIHPDEREVCRQEFEAMPASEEILSCYHEFSEALRQPWSRDPAAAVELAERQGDAVLRMMAV